MRLARCLQLMAVQEGLASGALPVDGTPMHVHPVGRDEDGDPAVVLTWPVSDRLQRGYVVAFETVAPEPWS